MFKYLLFGIILFVHTALVAQDAGSTPGTVPPPQAYDENVIEDDENVDEVQKIFVDTFLYTHPVSISPDTVQAWKNKKQLKNIKSLDSLLHASMVPKDNPDYKPSFLEAFFASLFFKVLAWILVVFVAGLIIYQLIANNGFFKPVGRKRKVEKYLEDEHKELEHDFDQLISQAVRQTDYRMAVRYGFLKLLKLLRQNGHIEFAIDKTNSQYLQEMPQRLRSEFKSVVHDYEYTWYGLFDINSEQYSTIQTNFSSFTRHLL